MHRHWFSKHIAIAHFKIPGILYSFAHGKQKF